MSEADLNDSQREHLWRGYSATRPDADLDGVRLRMAYWGPIVAIASIRWWLDRVVRIKRGERKAAMAGRALSFHTGELPRPAGTIQRDVAVTWVVHLALVSGGRHDKTPLADAGPLC